MSLCDIIKESRHYASSSLETNNGTEDTNSGWGSGKMLRVDCKGKIDELPKPPKGGLDGVIKTNDGQLMVTSQNGNAIYSLNKDNTYSVFSDSLD